MADAFVITQPVAVDNNLNLIAKSVTHHLPPVPDHQMQKRQAPKMALSQIVTTDIELSAASALDTRAFNMFASAVPSERLYIL
jgi:hypothetical protein